jgi:hypothetical protein
MKNKSRYSKDKVLTKKKIGKTIEWMRMKLLARPIGMENIPNEKWKVN